MHAWQVDRHGEPSDVLQWRNGIPEPVPGAGQVSVRVEAAACNFPDILMAQGKYQESPAFPFTPGLEVAGTVVAAGPGAQAASGDKVIGTPRVGQGGFADFVVLDRASTFPWPNGMTPAQAASMLITYQTAYCALHQRARIRAGETLLVHAGAGGVGGAAIQIAKAAGATVIATAGSDEKRTAALTMGADHVLDYGKDEWSNSVKTITDGRGADVVFDPVGGSIFDASRRVTAFEGRILSVGFAGGNIASAPTNHLLMKNYSVMGVHWAYYRKMRPDLIPQWQTELAELWEQKKISPLIDSERPVSEAKDALRRLANREVIGKAVLLH